MYGSSIARTMINSVSGEVLLRLEFVNVPFFINDVDRAYTIVMRVERSFEVRKSVVSLL